MRRLAKAATANFERKIWVLYADLGQVYLWCHASLCSASVFWNPAAAEVGIKMVFDALVPSPGSNMTAMTPDSNHST